MITLLLFLIVLLQPPAVEAPSADRLIALRLYVLVHSLPELQGTTLSIDVEHGRATVTGGLSHPNAEAAIRTAAPMIAGLRHLTLATYPKVMDPFAERIRRLLASPPAGMQPDTRVLAAPTTTSRNFAPMPELPHDAVTRLLAGDPRFAGLTFTLNEGILTLAGKAASYANVVECKRRLRGVAGLERIREAGIDAP